MSAQMTLDEVESVLAWLRSASGLLSETTGQERERLLVDVSETAEAARMACANQIGQASQLHQPTTPTLSDQDWSRALDTLVDLLEIIHSEARHLASAVEVEPLAISYGRAVVESVGAGGHADIEVSIGVGQNVLDQCFGRGDFDSDGTIVAFQLLGDSYRLRTAGDVVENLECAARSYQAGLRRADPSNYLRIKFLAALADLTGLLVSQGQVHWWRDTFGAPEELVANLHKSLPELVPGRLAQTASALWTFAEYAPLMPSERHHIATRAMSMTADLLRTPDRFNDATRSRLRTVLLSAAVLTYPWYGIPMVRWALRRVELSGLALDASTNSDDSVDTRALAGALALSRTRAHLLSAVEVLQCRIDHQQHGNDAAKDRLLLAAIQYTLLHDGRHLLVTPALDNLVSGLREHTGVEGDAFKGRFFQFGTQLNALVPVNALVPDQVPAPGRGTDPVGPDDVPMLSASVGARKKLDAPLAERDLWSVVIEFNARTVGVDPGLAPPIAAILKTEYLVTDNCPRCATSYQWTANIFVDEQSQPELFAALPHHRWHAFPCEYCNSEMHFQFPIFVQRAWPNFPCLLVVPDSGDELAPAVSTVEAVRSYLTTALPQRLADRIARAIPVSRRQMVGWAAISESSSADQSFDDDSFDSVLAGPRIRCVAETGPDGAPNSKLVNPANPFSFLGPSRDGYEHRLDPVSRFPLRREYRRREFRAWLDAPDNEAVLERRYAAVALGPYEDLVLIDEMGSCGLPMVDPEFSLWQLRTLYEIDVQLAELLQRESAHSAHQQAISIIREALEGNGRYVLFLRNFNLESHKLQPPAEFRDPYGLSGGSLFGRGSSPADAFPDKAASHVKNTASVVGISDSMAIYRMEHPSQAFAKLGVKSFEWLDILSLLVEYAAAIVVFLDDITAGTKLELTEVEKLGAQGKTGIFLINDEFFSSPGGSAETPASARRGRAKTKKRTKDLAARETAAGDFPASWEPPEGPSWRSELGDQVDVQRFAFVHSAAEGNTSWKGVLDLLLARTCGAKP